MHFSLHTISLSHISTHTNSYPYTLSDILKSTPQSLSECTVIKVHQFFNDDQPYTHSLTLTLTRSLTDKAFMSICNVATLSQRWHARNANTHTLFTLKWAVRVSFCALCALKPNTNARHRVSVQFGTGWRAYVVNGCFWLLLLRFFFLAHSTQLVESKLVSASVRVTRVVSRFLAFERIATAAAQNATFYLSFLLR